MTHLTITLVALVAVLATSNELSAQRRTPLRNFARSIGGGWGAGNHARNPGPIIDYYSPWSQANTPAGPYSTQEAEGRSSGDVYSYPNDLQNNGQVRENNASTIRLAPDNRSIQRRESESSSFSIDSTSDTTFQTNQQINQYMQPWQNPTTPSTPSINGQPRFDFNDNDSQSRIRGSGNWIPARNLNRQSIEPNQRQGR